MNKYIEQQRLIRVKNLNIILGTKVSNLQLKDKNNDLEISFHSDGIPYSFSSADFEKKIIRSEIRKVIPDGYKISTSEDDSIYLSHKMSIESKSKHMTLVFAYAKSELGAAIKCLLSLKAGVEMSTEVEHDSRSHSQQI